MSTQRGQSPVIGVVLLIGFVFAAVGGVLLVGSTAISTVQDQSDREHEMNELQSVSHQFDTVVQSGDSDSEVELQNDYQVSDDPELEISVGGETLAADMQRLEGDDFVYEGGMIIEDGAVVQEPRFAVGDDSTTIRIPDLGSSANGFDGGISYNETRSDQSNEAFELSITSEHADVWLEYLEEEFEETPATVTLEGDDTVLIEYDGGSELPEISNSLHLGLSDDGTSFDLSDIPTTEIDSYDESVDPRSNPMDNARVEAIIEESGDQGGDIHVEGAFIYEGEYPNQGGNDKVSDTEDGPREGEIDEAISTEELLVESQGSQYDGGTTDLDGGVFYNNDDELWISDVDVTEETVLIVENDLHIDDGEALTLYDSLDIHVHGSVTFEDDAVVQTKDEYNADQLSMFTNGDVDAAGEFTGLIHASNNELAVRDEFRLFGAAVTDELVISDDANPSNHQHNKFYLHYDERLENTGPYATSETIEIYDSAEEKSGDIHQFDVRVEQLDID